VSLVCALALAVPAWALPKNPEAAKLLEDGQVKYKAEKFDAAIEDFKKGYDIEPDPAFLIAWAQAERQRGRCGAAVRLYQKFLATDPPEVAQEFARDGIVRCADQLAADQPLPPGADELTPIDEPDEPLHTLDGEDDDQPDEPTERKPKNGNRWYRDPLGTSLVAIGVAGSGVGAGLLVAAQLESSKEVIDYGEFDAQQRRIRNLRITGGVVLGVGAGLLIGGIVRWAIVGTRKSDTAASVGLILDRDQAGLTLSGRF
jgi:tetratricopeptide (TPR) repeat protein